MTPVTSNLCWDDPIDEECILRWPQYLVMWSILTFFLWFSPRCGAKAYYAGYLCKRQRNVYTLLLSAFSFSLTAHQFFPSKQLPFPVWLLPVAWCDWLMIMIAWIWLVDRYDGLNLIGWWSWLLEIDWRSWMLEDVYLNSNVLSQLCYLVSPAYTGSNSQCLAYESFALIMRRKL